MPFNNYENEFGMTTNLTFGWTRFYHELADKLLTHREDRTYLVEAFHEIFARPDLRYPLQDKYPDGSTGLMQDLCPFTTIGAFNRGISDANRTNIAARLGGFLGVREPAPDSFQGIPVLNNQMSRLFRWAKDRKDGDIELLWRVFADAIAFADSGSRETMRAFEDSYNHALRLPLVSNNLTIGLFWIRPSTFLSLDSKSRTFITRQLGIRLPSGKPPAGHIYLDLLAHIEERFAGNDMPVHSFQELSLAAYGPNTGVPSDLGLRGPNDGEKRTPVQVPQLPEPREAKKYTINDILDEGCFLERSTLERTIVKLKEKKNLILQGPPGTGKTWLAKKLAFALIEQKDDRRVRSYQFHPNLSYEDFIRGYRPDGDGKLSLVDGPFLELIDDAKNDPSNGYVMVIEEINRGNPAQIFGEMLTLLEADKRDPSEALRLTHSGLNAERVYIPPNVYVIGTMNVADRSIALVDLALRRRFAFVNLEPTFGEVWRDWVHDQFGVSHDFLVTIEKRITDLNERIAGDHVLGPQFCIGHSYLTPRPNAHIPDPVEWFTQVVETEIGPLLDEYWFDRTSEEAKKAKLGLLSNL